jgi:predicted acylesterase/phospholipase RssA
LKSHDFFTLINNDQTLWKILGKDGISMNQKAENVLSDGQSRIGLALSGGGFRASLYHLGTIRYLEEAGVMPRVEVMSTVSGGSIIGAYYLVEMERRLRARTGKNRLELCDEIINEFSKSLKHNFRMRALVFYPFYYPVQALLVLLRLRHAGDTMARAFEKLLFAPSLRIGDLPVQIAKGRQTPDLEDATDANEEARHFEVSGTRILINTTSLITGRRVVFSRESDTGLKAQIEKLDPNNIILARAVGASASVPGMFKPLRIGNEILSDGGVVDNQGIESLFDYFQISDETLNLLPDAFRQSPVLRRDSSGISGLKPLGDIYFIISDGAGQFPVQSSGKATRAGSASRSMGILQAANRRKILKLLLDVKKNSDIKEFAFTHLAMNLKGRTGGDRLPSEFIVPTAEIRTDLDEFSRLERDALIYHGYSLMKHQIGHYCSELEEKPIAPSQFEEDHFSWPPPFVELCNPTKGKKERAKAARYKIEKYLRIGQSTLFKDTKRFPWTFTPMLLFFLLLGHTVSTILITWKIGKSGQSIEDILTESVRARAESFIPSLQWLPDWCRDIINYAVHLEDLQKCFEKNGSLAGTLEFIVAIVCVVLSFYVALWLFWVVKQWSNLSSSCEQKMMEKLSTISSRDETPGNE